eukprot:TRINITY_DN4064_c0_g1_i2.p1 TRINITY_DN4064_c0_g1~~TRINITY_DN4064_c0_g1_i2.p1  ORF type:complete len:448 (-),score=187.70 TRINITY_DN4064_c0_g1_i2:340-1683(-)
MGPRLAIAGARSAGRRHAAAPPRWSAAVAVAAAAAAVAVLVGGGPTGVDAAAQPLWWDGRRQFTFDPLWSFTDEFESRWLDKNKWQDWNPHWIGRAPAVFKWSNIFLNSGDLVLKARRDPQWSYPANPPSLADLPPIYNTWTSAFMQTWQAVRYGFFEVRAKPMDSVFSSAFWFSSNTAKRWTELDVFEIGGGASGGPGPGHRYTIHTNFHVFRDVDRGIFPSSPVSAPRNTYHNDRLAAAYHVYAMDWDAERIQWLFNGRVIRSERNVGHHQYLRLKLDSESFPYWFGLPSPDFRSSLFRVSYVRGWSKRNMRRQAGRMRGKLPPPVAFAGVNASAPGVATVGVGGEPVFVVSAPSVGVSDAAVVTKTAAAADLDEDVGVSPFALQRAPSPDSPEVILRSPPVPFVGWEAAAAAAASTGIRVARRARYFAPRVLAADTFVSWNAGD